MTSTIPKPIFDSCDETSLKLKSEYILSAGQSLFIQIKEPHQEWTESREVSVAQANQENAIALADIADLKPGTAYVVRLFVKSEDGSFIEGPQTVFDTKPIDCTPKKKNCVIS